MTVSLWLFWRPSMQKNSREKYISYIYYLVCIFIFFLNSLKVIPDKSWRLKDIRESCQQTEQMIRIVS